jgi:hypothetical protein
VSVDDNEVRKAIHVLVQDVPERYVARAVMRLAGGARSYMTMLWWATRRSVVGGLSADDAGRMFALVGSLTPEELRAEESLERILIEQPSSSLGGSPKVALAAQLFATVNEYRRIQVVSPGNNVWHLTDAIDWSSMSTLALAQGLRYAMGRVAPVDAYSRSSRDIAAALARECAGKPQIDVVTDVIQKLLQADGPDYRGRLVALDTGLPESGPVPCPFEAEE